MMRYVVIVLATALACLALTGLRVALLEALPRHEAELLSPRTLDEGDPPPAAPPVDTIAGRAGRRMLQGASWEDWPAFVRWPLRSRLDGR